MYCFSCGQQLEGRGNFCEQCGEPTLGRDIPRDVRLRLDFGVVSKIAAFCLVYGTLSALFVYFIVGPLVVKRYGRAANAVIQGVTAGAQGRRGVNYVMHAQYKDAQGYLRLGQTASNGQEFKAQPIGQTLTVRYFNGYPFIGRAGPADGFDECFSVLFLLLTLLLLGAMLRQLNARKRLLSLGTLQRAVVTDFRGHNTRTIEVEYGESVKTVRTFVFRGARPPKIGSKLWILEDGSPEGIAILEPSYEWECARYA